MGWGLFTAEGEIDLDFGGCASPASWRVCGLWERAVCVFGGAPGFARGFEKEGAEQKVNASKLGLCTGTSHQPQPSLGTTHVPRRFSPYALLPQQQRRQASLCLYARALLPHSAKSREQSREQSMDALQRPSCDRLVSTCLPDLGVQGI
jgi:hypothetical protein